MSVASSSESLHAEILFIRSEEDAYNFLERSRSTNPPLFSRIEFEGWPVLDLSLKGDKFNQSITPSVMKGLLEFQKGIYKSYAVAKYGSSSKRLTEFERDQLEIKVNVNKGSSIFGINFTQIANHAVDQLSGIMSPEEIGITIVMIAVLYFGNSAYKNYLEDRRKTRIEEINGDYQKAVLAALAFRSPHQVERAKLINDLASSSDRNMQIFDAAQEAQHSIIKSLGAGSQGAIGDTITLSKEASEILAASPRRKSKEVRLDGDYMITRIDWSTIGRFRVRIELAGNGLQLEADVQDESLDGKHKEAIKAAEWSRRAVRLQVNAKSFGDNDYRDAVIVSAQSIE